MLLPFKKLLTHWLPLVLSSAFIFFASVVPVPRPIEAVWVGYAEHFIVYAIYAVLVMRICRRFGIAVLASSVYGIAMEIAQFYFPPRTPSLADALTNLLGACAGGGICLFCWKWSRCLRV